MFSDKKRKRLNRLIKGLENLDRMRKEIRSFVQIIAYYIKHASVSDLNKKDWLIDIDDVVRLKINIGIVERPNIPVAILPISIEFEFQGEKKWYQIFLYDGAGNKVTKEMNGSYVRRVFQKLPEFEEKLQSQMENWERGLLTILAASEEKL